MRPNVDAQKIESLMQALGREAQGSGYINLNELPGAELILPGLDELRNGKADTVGALLVAIAATRLTAAGLDIPKSHLVPEPELKLYSCLQGEQDDAYTYYNALLNRLNSFCNALELNYKICKPCCVKTKLTIE